MAALALRPRLRRATSRPARAHEQKSLLRFLTCGSVDDGKSTLIGRLLYDSKLLFDDQLAALERDFKKVGTTGGDIDFALLVDGLAGRARAGHHHRRRLSLLRHRRSASSSSPTRPAMSNTRATWRPAPRPPTSPSPDRCAQGRADADPPPQLHRLAARHPPRRARGQQDGPGRLSTRRRFDDDRRATIAQLRRAARLRAITVASRCRRCTATMSSSRSAQHALVHGPDAARASRDGRRRRRRREREPFRMPVQWVNRPNLDFRGYRRHDRRRDGAPGRRRRRRCRPGKTRACRAHRHRWTAISTRPSRARP